MSDSTHQKNTSLPVGYYEIQKQPQTIYISPPVSSQVTFWTLCKWMLYLTIIIILTPVFVFLAWIIIGAVCSIFIALFASIGIYTVLAPLTVAMAFVFDASF